MKELFNLYQINKTCKQIEIPQDKKILLDQLVYKKKYGSESAIKQYKAHQVIKCYHQFKCIDYDKTFINIVKSII